MGNSAAGTTTKMLTLIPVLVAVYYYDFAKFWTALISPGALAFFLSACSLFVVGVLLKRRILAARLELSRISFGWGLSLLALACLLYVYGSYSSDVVWYHYESLYVLIIAYVALRIGTSVIRALAPLLGIFAFALPPSLLFPDALHQELVVFLAADLIFVFFLAYVGLRLRAMATPSGVLLLGLTGWISAEVGLLHTLYLELLIPVPALLLLTPQVRRFGLLPHESFPTVPHDHRLFANGFCSLCGSKVTKGVISDNVGLWGLLAVLGVAALIIFASVPALAYNAGVPHDIEYTARGFSETSLPQVPAGWQVNTTTIEKLKGDVFASSQVDVPIYHPETENYTVDYELSTLNVPSTSFPFGQLISGWNRTSNMFTEIGPYQGYLTTYTDSNAVMVTFHGAFRALFLTGSGFASYYGGLGFVRQFKNTNVGADEAQFLSDINSLWLPLMTQSVTYGSWTNFLNSLQQGGQVFEPLLLLLGSIMAVAWVVYRVGLSDERLDRFLSLAPSQSARDWECISLLLERARHSGTTLELASGETVSWANGLGGLDSGLRELQGEQLVMSSLIERGADLISVWKLPV